MVLPATTRRLADGIPGAAFTELAGAGHRMSAAHRADWLGQVPAFLGSVTEQRAASASGSAPPPPSGR